MNLYKRLFQYVKPYSLRALQAALCMVLVALLTSLTIWMIRTVVDEVLIARDAQKLLWVTLSLPLLYLLKGFFAYVQNYMMNYISHSIIRDLRLELYAHLQNLSMDYFHKNATGRLMSKITNDTTLLRGSLTQVPTQIVRDGLTLVFLLGTIFYLHWKFALITLVLLPLAAVPITVLGKKMRRSGRETQVLMADLFMTLQEGIVGNLISKIFGRENHEIRRFDAQNKNLYSVTMRWVRADVLGAPIMEFMGSLAAVFLLWYGGKDVIDGRWTAGSFFTFLGASISCYKPVKDFTSVNALIQQGVACAERIFEVLDERPTVVEKKDCAALAPFQKEIHFKNVSFAYETSQTVLNNIDLRIRSGEVVALVGQSGSGKTTLTHLLPRLFDPQAGQVLVDGADIRQMSLASLRRQIGIVTQETLLFNETVRYNIAYGFADPALDLPQVPLESIEAAAKVANAHAFIRELPQGYDTVIGEKGLRLSGGQKQRLSIARAVLKNPPILILDEATSALDTESEKLVQEAIDRLMENRTVLVVAHRLSTIRRADRIVVLEKGRIVEEGNHDALMQKSGSYKKYYELQIQA